MPEVAILSQIVFPRVHDRRTPTPETEGRWQGCGGSKPFAGQGWAGENLVLPKLCFYPDFVAPVSPPCGERPAFKRRFRGDLRHSFGVGPG